MSFETEIRRVLADELERALRPLEERVAKLEDAIERLLGEDLPAA